MVRVEAAIYSAVPGLGCPCRCCVRHVLLICYAEYQGLGHRGHSGHRPARQDSWGPWQCQQWGASCLAALGHTLQLLLELGTALSPGNALPTTDQPFGGIFCGPWIAASPVKNRHKISPKPLKTNQYSIQRQLVIWHSKFLLRHVQCINSSIIWKWELGPVSSLVQASVFKHHCCQMV